jgi:hypothetical protein
MTDKPVRRRRKRSQAKDRVLQARIPEQLDDELRGRAEQLGLSVSTIVRNVLLNTFELVEGVVTDSSQIARALSARHETLPTSQAALPAPPDGDADSAASVIGWQEVVLNKNGICEECNAILPLGESAAIGLPTGARAILLCMSCLGLRTPPVAVAVKSKVPRKKKKVPAPKSAADPKKTTR